MFRFVMWESVNVSVASVKTRLATANGFMSQKFLCRAYCVVGRSCKRFPFI